jgi:large subunit ribosomal protein L9
MATESNKKIIAENQKQAAHKIAKVINDAKAIADQLSKTEVKLPVKVGTSGKLFGSITTLQISRTLKELGFEVDRKDITLKDEIKEIGSYKISIKVHKDVHAEVNLHINREEEK